MDSTKIIFVIMILLVFLINLAMSLPKCTSVCKQLEDGSLCRKCFRRFNQPLRFGKRSYDDYRSDIQKTKDSPLMKIERDSLLVKIQKNNKRINGSINNFHWRINSWIDNFHWSNLLKNLLTKLMVRIEFRFYFINQFVIA